MRPNPKSFTAPTTCIADGTSSSKDKPKEEDLLRTNGIFVPLLSALADDSEVVVAIMPFTELETDVKLILLTLKRTYFDKIIK